ncbi:hypothetical protein RHGRI_020625 [Rhododendron griersonianum]|uniref:Uncharacterized protein n=1 Tax=Rhododendron griersonianum TaxID=479676 RepID=A0AAV6JJ21_9ERIC|nr:hypothetical protein RHGRI_020625 [Rhododendron griersonianum]
MNLQREFPVIVSTAKHTSSLFQKMIKTPGCQEEEEEINSGPPICFFVYQRATYFSKMSCVLRSIVYRLRYVTPGFGGIRSLIDKMKNSRGHTLKFFYLSVAFKVV